MSCRNGWMAYSISAFCLLPAVQHASAAFFVPLGHLHVGKNYSVASDVSADGSVVVGFSETGPSPDYGGEVFRWTSYGGLVGLGDPPEGLLSSASGVSADGSVVVGGGYTANGLQAFRWTSDGGMVGLGDRPGSGFYSYAYAISADGSVVVGKRGGNPLDGGEAFRWTSDGGMLGLGDLPGGEFYSVASGVSADGSVVVGNGISANGGEAFRWTSVGGMVGLGDLPGGDFGSTADGVSSDGSVIVGSSYTGFLRDLDGSSEAYRWTSEGSMIGLGDLPGGLRLSGAYDVSADGSVVVGWGYSEIGREAFVWDAANGMRSVSDMLTDLGVDLTGWTLEAAAAISADATTIVGRGVNPFGQIEAWLANISAPADYDGNGLVDQGDLDLVLLNWGAIATVPPDGWANDLPIGAVDQDELDKVLLNWGSAASTLATTSVPEPSAAVLLLVCFVALYFRGRQLSAWPRCIENELQRKFTMCLRSRLDACLCRVAGCDSGRTRCKGAAPPPEGKPPCCPKLLSTSHFRQSPKIWPVSATRVWILDRALV